MSPLRCESSPRHHHASLRPSLIKDERSGSRLPHLLKRRSCKFQAHRLLDRNQSPGRPCPNATRGWFGALMDEHYVSDDTNVRLLARCILTAYARSVWRISSHRNRPTLRLLLLHDDAE